MHEMILSKAQVEAVYRAMCDLNNVYGKAKMMMPNHDGSVCIVKEVLSTGQVLVVKKMGDDVLKTERFSNQNTFVKAYGLDD